MPPSSPRRIIAIEGLFSGHGVLLYCNARWTTTNMC